MSDVTDRNPPLREQKTFARMAIDKFDGFVLLAILFTYLLVGASPFKAKRFGDAVFFKEAKSVAQAIHGSKSWRDVTITQAPGPVIYYAIPYSMMPSSASDNAYWLAGLIWTIPLICLSVLMIRRAATYWAGLWNGKIAALLALLIPLSVYYSYGVWAESLAYIGAAVTCFGGARLQASSEPNYRPSGSIAILALGITILILARPNAILVLAIGAMGALIMLTRVDTRRQGKFALLAILLASFISVGALLLVSAVSHGSQQDVLAHAAFPGRFQYRTEPWDWRFWTKEHRVGSADFEMAEKQEALLLIRAEQAGVSLDSLKREWVIQDWLAHPEVTLQQFAIRCLTLNLLVVKSRDPSAFGIFFIPGKVVYVLFHIVVNGVYCLVLLGSLYFIVKQRRHALKYWMLWAPYVGLFTFHSLVYAEHRYLLPSIPGLAVMAGLAIGPLLRVKVFSASMPDKSWPESKMSTADVRTTCDAATSPPLVSVLMPVRNEASFIERSLTSVLNQDYQLGRIEVIIADGMSNDKTRAIVEALQRDHGNLRLIDNPGKIVATGLNAAQRVAKGEIIVRVDGHTVIDSNYVRECVEALQMTEADNVGGRMTAVSDGWFGRAVAAATGSRFGVGGARFHYSDHEEWVDTVYLGAWRREIFDRIGMFDEEMVRNQDDEFNYRLRAAGGRIRLSPKIKSRYYNRATPLALWRQYFQYGFWKVRVLQKHPRQMQLRQFVPPAFVFALLSLLLAGAISKAVWLAGLVCLSSYAIANLFASFSSARREDWRLMPLLPVAFLIIHLAYGFGFLFGMIRFWNRWELSRNVEAVRPARDATSP